MGEEVLSLIKNLNKISAEQVKPKVDFNVLTALHIEHREVYICRLIGGLLVHSSEIRKLFGQIVLKNQTDDFENATVILEEVIDEQRRVDIVIKTDKHIYPIEAKIYAGDQDAQLCDYWDYYRKNDSEHFVNGKIYYLTSNGKEPSKESRGFLKEEIVKISFRDEIRLWLDAVEKNKLCKDTKYVVQEFQEVVNIMCNGENLINQMVPDDNFLENYNALCSLFENQNGIISKLRKKYIKTVFEKNTSLTERYELDDTDIREVLSGEKIIYIVRLKNNNSKTIAKICVDWNLYVRPNDDLSIKESEIDKWRDKDKKPWQYIKTKNNSEVNLREPWLNKNAISDSDEFINIEELLNSIEF